MTAQSPALQPATPPLFVSILNTEYFEIESTIVGARFAVWVTTPPGYGADPNRAYPAIYMPDGNLATALTAPINFMEDIIEPKLPYVQVSVGYTMNDMANIMVLRNRDLLPPGEPINPATGPMIDQMVAAGSMTAEQGAFMMASLQNTRADAFLSFLTDELHPQIAAKYKIDETACGLFGFSLGGLFALYAALKRAPLFTCIGAGSPGIHTLQSKIFELLEQEIRAGADHTGRSLHVTVNELEITKPGYFQFIGHHFSRFASVFGAAPLKGLHFTSHVIPYETHSTGPTPAFSSFLRTLYAVK
jgi:hypothetical protein